MTVELRPTGVACNIQCQYCYQTPIRDADNIPRSYDLEAMKAAVEREGGPFTVFGGEPLLVPEEDLETLWAWGLERWDTNGIQTNGVLIKPKRMVDDDTVLTAKEAKTVRRGEGQLKRGASKPWRDVKHALAR